MRVYNNKNNLGRSITDKNFVMRVITLILAAVTAVVIFVKPQGAAAAQKKSKQAEGGVNMSLKNGVLTVKEKVRCGIQSAGQRTKRITLRKL